MPISLEAWESVTDGDIASELGKLRGTETRSLFQDKHDPTELVDFTKHIERMNQGIEGIKDNVALNQEYLLQVLKEVRNQKKVLHERVEAWDPQLSEFLVAIGFADGDDPTIAARAWKAHTKANLSRTRFAAASTVCDLKNDAFVKYTLELANEAIASVREAKMESSFRSRIVGPLVTNEMAIHILRLFFLEECVRFIDDEKSRTYESEFESVVEDYVALARKEKISLKHDASRVIAMVTSGLEPQRRELATKKGFTEHQRMKLDAEYMKAIDATIEFLRRNGAEIKVNRKSKGE